MYNRYDGPSRGDGAQRAIPADRRGAKAQMSMEDWIQFMNEAQFIDNEKITLQKGQESFVAAQMHSRIHQSVSKKAIKADEGAFKLMDFGEYLEAFAQLYSDFAELIRDSKDKDKIKKILPNEEDGLHIMKFINSCVNSSNQNSRWIDLNA